jgi:hypothetical protein
MGTGGTSPGTPWRPPHADGAQARKAKSESPPGGPSNRKRKRACPYGRSPQSRRAAETVNDRKGLAKRWIVKRLRGVCRSAGGPSAPRSRSYPAATLLLLLLSGLLVFGRFSFSSGAAMRAVAA